MWAQQLVAPYTFEAVEVPAPTGADLRDGDVLLKMLTTGICGSDLPFVKGSAVLPHAQRPDGTTSYPPGAPLHEIVGEVVESRDPALAPGSLVVGWADANGLAEYVVVDGSGLYEYDRRWLPDQAIMLQPLACTIFALERLPGIRGARTAVIGLGPIGVLFAHVLKQLGAASVVGVDRVDRSDVASVFGLDEAVHASSEQWAAAMKESANRPSVIVEAVGHQPHTLRDAVDALAPEGHIYCFGVPDEDTYPFPMRVFLRKNAQLSAGVTLKPQRRGSLAKADAHLQAHPELVEHYISNVLKAEEATEAFRLAVTPAAGQLKIIMRAP